MEVKRLSVLVIPLPMAMAPMPPTWAKNQIPTLAGEITLPNGLKANKGTENVSVINEGIGSNSILGSYPTDAGKDRFNRDLLEHDGVAYCIILFGVNDLDKLQNTDKYNLLLPEYQKMIETCHKNNIKVYGAPILPFGTSSFYSENSEKVRQLINQWMRSSESGVDGIIDFENAGCRSGKSAKFISQIYKQRRWHPSL